MTAIGGTYCREPLPHHMRACCPLCCRPIQVHADGRMVRHGWQERGRKVGSTGLGFQWGECPGTGERPLEQTDADGLKNVDVLNDAIAQWQTVVAEHVAGKDYYDVTIEIPEHEQPAHSYEGAKARQWTASGLEEIGSRVPFREYLRAMVKVTYRVPRGFELEGKRVTISYERLRAAAQSEAEHHVKTLERARDTLLAMIEHWRATEPVRKAERVAKQVVHFQHTLIRITRTLCGLPVYRTRTTTDRPTELR